MKKWRKLMACYLWISNKLEKDRKNIFVLFIGDEHKEVVNKTNGKCTEKYKVGCYRCNVRTMVKKI